MSSLMNQTAYTGVARNFSHASENRMHDDSVAAQMGFEGALVPGVAVFGIASIPLIQTHGTALLENHTWHTRFLKPAYHDQSVRVQTAATASGCEATLYNDTDTLLCTLQVHNGTQAPEFEQHALTRDATPLSQQPEERPLISWDSVHTHEPFPICEWTPTYMENAERAAQVGDEQPPFAAPNGPIHPHLLLGQANTALVNRYQMPAWIHVGSEIRMHHLLRADSPYHVHTTVIRKWEKKGHQFLTAYIAFESSGELVTEILHTAIFSIAGSRTANAPIGT